MVKMRLRGPRIQPQDPIDVATPDFAKTRIGFDGEEYKLVFSGEFEVPERMFTRVTVPTEKRL